MPARRWTSILTGLVVAGLGGVFVLVGLETADKLASTVGAIASVAGLGLTLYLSLAQRPGHQSDPSRQTDTADSQRSGTTDAGDEADTRPPARRHPTVQIDHVQGAQFGDHNTQHNDFF